ncbi:MAG TPA: hypothetical protein VLA21_09050 [Candidatus Limnocylindria bacterium]|nr:hypothetical protein [Candidatus Limnocylindria bacterium]
MKNIRKETSLGILLLLLWVVIRIISVPVLLWLLGIVGVALIVIGLLPESLHEKVVGGFNDLTGRKKT